MRSKVMAMSDQRQDANAGADSLTRYLPCRVEPGMFKGELLVYLDGLDPEIAEKLIHVQMLVDEQEVVGLDREPKRNQPATGWVRVTLAREVSGFAKVVLPQPAQPVGESLLVDAERLRIRPGP